MNFGPSARDYARYRAGFPASFFERVKLGGRVLDVGSGTGTLARGFEAKGARVVASDLSPAMLAEAAGLRDRVAARAEALPFRDAAFDGACAGQCWHWFDRPVAARELFRLLAPGGTLVVAHFDYLARAGNAAAETERLILEVNPGWPAAGLTGFWDVWRPDLEAAGFTGVESVTWEEDVVYTHEAWRGRTRANNGVIALRDPGRIAAFDAELARRLAASFGDPLPIPHRVFALAGRKP